MSYFMDFIEKIRDFIFLASSDSEEQRASKILWYSLFGGILLIIIVSYTIFVMLSFSSKGVSIPNITGDTIYVGLRKLSDVDLCVRISTRYSDETPEGVIIGQNPKQGSFVKKGRRVILTVSMGAKTDSLPDFTQMSLFQIMDLLRNQYIDGKIPYSINERYYEFSDTVEKGHVIRQEPAEGTPIKSVKRVKLWLSNGMKKGLPATLPSFVDERLYDALDIIKKQELNVNVMFTPTTRRQEHYQVQSQNYDEGVLIEDIQKEQATILLNSLVYLDQNRDYFKGDIATEVPYKNVPFVLRVIRKEETGQEEVIFSMTTRGGFYFSLPYSVRKFSTLKITADTEILTSLIVQ